MESRRGFLGAALAGVALPAVHAAGDGTIRVGVIGCGGRGTEAATNAMNAGKDVRVVALGDVVPGRVAETRTALRVKYAAQVDVPDDRMFSGFEAYRGVIEASDVVIVANAAKFHPMHL